MFLFKFIQMDSRSVATKRLKQTNLILSPKRAFGSVKQGSKYSTSFREYLEIPNGEIGSYFHDIPLKLDREKNTVRMVVEVPRWSNAKFEISKELNFNPIVQDTKKGEVRFVHNIFPYHGYIHNYGAIPQTWEDPTVVSDQCAEPLKGDNDPLDCCEIGSEVLNTGAIKTVKILGSLALIDDGELDWKIIAINTEDRMASRLHDLNDVNEHLPGILNATREWFRTYKIPAGKPANEFAFNEEYRNVKETLATIEECHEAWKKLVSGSLSEQFEGLPQIERAGNGVIMESDEQPPTSIPSEIHRWCYIKA